MNSDSGSRAERQDRNGLGPEDGRAAPEEGHRQTSGANLTPSVVERIRAEAFEKVESYIYGLECRALADIRPPEVQAALDALALPSEPPSQGDVEGRARELLADEYARLGFAEAADCVRRGKPAGWLTEDVAIRAIVKALATKEDGRS